MWRLLPLLLTIAITACRTAPPLLTEARVEAMDPVTLCRSAGEAFARNDSVGFHLVMTEIGRRHEGPSAGECAALAQIGANTVEANAARRQAMAAAWRDGMAKMQEAYKPKPAATCTTIGNTTSCQGY